MENTKKNTEAFVITGDWAVQSKELRKKYAKLTDADLKFEKGKEDDLLKDLKQDLTKKREEVIDIIRDTQS